MKKIRQQISNQKTSKINQQKSQATHSTYDHIRKKVQRKHIQEKMGCIHMQKTWGKQPDILPSTKGTAIEFVLLEKVYILKTFKRNKYVGCYDNKSYYVQLS